MLSVNKLDLWVINMIKLKTTDDFGGCAKVSGEVVDGEYSELYIFVEFEKEISHEFRYFLQNHLFNEGIKSHKGRNYEVDKIHGRPNELLITFSAGYTEYKYFEEYFEDERFKEFMENAIKEYSENPDKYETK